MSTRVLVDETEAASDSYVYSAFGEQLVSVGDTVNAYRYTGEQWEGELDATYLRARYMDNARGRLWGLDPICNSRECQNLYAYASNSPLDTLDPSGEADLFLTSLMTAVGITGIQAAIAVPSYANITGNVVVLNFGNIPNDLISDLDKYFIKDNVHNKLRIYMPKLITGITRSGCSSPISHRLVKFQNEFIKTHYTKVKNSDYAAQFADSDGYIYPLGQTKLCGSIAKVSVARIVDKYVEQSDILPSYDGTMEITKDKLINMYILVTLHELGHTYGLDHEITPDYIMSESYNSDLFLSGSYTWRDNSKPILRQGASFCRKR